MSIVSQELDYQPKPVSHGDYVMSKITPQVALDATNSVLNAGGQESIFEIPAKVINLGKSVLSFTATPVGQTTGGTLGMWANVDGFPFVRQLQLYTREGLMLCDIQDCNMFMKSVSRRVTKHVDARSRDIPSSGAGGGYFEGIFPNNSAVDAVPAVRYTNGSSKVPYGEIGYMLSGTVDNAAHPLINVQIPLSRFVHSVVGINKDQYFGQSVYLRLVWAPATDTYFVGTSMTDPTAGVAAYAGNITIGNLTLYGAIEQNPLVVQSLMDKFKNGSLSYNVNYIHMNTQSLTAGTNNLSVRYNRAHGSKLKRIYWSPFKSSNVTNNKYNNSNAAGVKFTEFYSMINNNRLQQYNYTQASGNEWLSVKDDLKGSCILSSDEFDYNYCHLEKWTGGTSTDTDSNLDDGLPLDEEVKYDLQVTAAAALKHYIWGITQKKLTVTPTGVQLM